MQLLSAPNQLKSRLRWHKTREQSIGFVPTMGALHDGHLTLIRKAKSENDVCVVSIFVNPIQFDKEEDLEKYPRVLEEDIAKLVSFEIDYLFTPEEAVLYPSKPTVSIDFGPMAQTLEGKFRKGHFDGVGIIVSKLFHIVEPDVAYFGLKDLQQYLLIKKMCEDFNFPVKVVGVETVREASGLAMSSRNRRLSENGQKVASQIYGGLEKIKAGVQSGEHLIKLLEEANKFYSRTEGLKVEYLEAVNPNNLQMVDSYMDLSELAICFAGYVEEIRLIDNLYLQLK